MSCQYFVLILAQTITRLTLNKMLLLPQLTVVTHNYLLLQTGQVFFISIFLLWNWNGAYEIANHVKVPLFIVEIQYKLLTLVYDPRNVPRSKKEIVYFKKSKKYFHSNFPRRNSNFICTNLNYILLKSYCLYQREIICGYYPNTNKPVRKIWEQSTQ